MGEYIRAAEETKSRKYISYDRICVFIRLNEALPESVTLAHRDEEWIQPLDYEHVPFRCRKCHALGHLFRDCPQNVQNSLPDSSDTPAQDGFTKVPSRKRSHKKPQNGFKPQPNKSHGLVTKNSFDILGQASEELPSNVEANPDHPSSSSPPPSSNPPPKSPSPIIIPTILKRDQKDAAEILKEMEVDGKTDLPQNPETSIEDSDQVQIMEEEPESIDLNGLDILELELACKKKAYDTIPELQLNKLKVIISRAYHQNQLGIQPGNQWDGSLRPKDTKKRGRKTDLQRTIEIGKILVDSGRYAKLTKYYKPSVNG